MGEEKKDGLSSQKNREGGVKQSGRRGLKEKVSKKREISRGGGDGNPSRGLAKGGKGVK